MLKLTVVISAFLLATCGDAAPRTRRPRLDARIVGGVDANITEVPYQLSMEYGGDHVCGACILDEWVAITAAACLYGVEMPDVRFRAGSSLRETGGSVHRIEEVVVHPKYDFVTNDYDIALVLMKDPFEFNENVAPISIASKVPDPGYPADLSGWGTTSSGYLPSQLQKVTVRIVDHDTCNEAYAEYGGITENMICAGVEEGGKDSCMGDSGSPLVVAGKLVGTVSWGLGCGEPGYPGVNTNLPAMTEQLRSLMHGHPRLSKLNV